MAFKIMIIAGEASGDMHGSELIRALKSYHPDAEIVGVGGNRMKSAGMDILYHIDQLAFIGFIEVLKHYFFFKKVFKDLINYVQLERPDILILIDYPGFNLRFAKKAKKLGTRTFYYISPQVWAWGQSRAKKMAKYIDRMAVIFDFEVDFFSRYGLDTIFVGHPLADQLEIKESKESFCRRVNLDPSKPILALLPGSRKQEVQTLLPVMLSAAGDLRKENKNVQIAVGLADTIDKTTMLDGLYFDYPVFWVEKSTYVLVKHANAAVVASGTATLETAFLGTPFIIVYKVAPLTYYISKMLIKIPYIGLVNVVAGKQIITELLQDKFNSVNLKGQMKKLLFDNRYRSEILSNLSIVRGKLKEGNAADNTAKLVLKTLNDNDS